MADNNKPSDSLEFPVTSQQKAIADVIAGLAGTGKWPAFHAIRHLNKAWMLKDIDTEMALFRAITAEEEAATAVFRAIQARGYDNANKLKPRDHIYKNALSSFILSVNNKFVSKGFIKGGALVFDEANRLGIVLSLKIDENLSTPPFSPIPPLEFKVAESFGNNASGPVDFRQYFNDIVEAEGATLKQYLQERANVRNRLLYAADTGYPAVQEFVQPFERYKRTTFINLAVYLLIVQYREKQSFVQDALNSFLQVVDSVR